ncbi:hypothetical protein Nepgr_010975 [Nepenthes gracilis]|uniref:Uncharacterized protein n=1 Tax=Nepenthes gracilis TaxID=150966 RepID=A0AAD3XLV0_NEPGR|nr:hypothetical protein Nepgr_010975 [Nepenthes gracilis]
MYNPAVIKASTYAENQRRIQCGFACHGPISDSAIAMKPRNNVGARGQKSKNFKGEGPNWMLIAGGALLSTLSIRLGYKLKQALEAKQPENSTLNGSGKSANRQRLGNCHQHSNMYTFGPEEYSCFNCTSGAECMAEAKNPSNARTLAEPDSTLPLVAISLAEHKRENGMVWAPSPERLEQPSKSFNHSTCSDSPCVSESGSDIFSKREVMQKLRQQLRRRDDMILEIQDQIVEMQNALSAQVSHSNHLQSQLDATNRLLFDSEREGQRLMKALADHCVEHAEPNKHSEPSEGRNGHANGYLVDGEGKFEIPGKSRADRERIEMLKEEIEELKEVIRGKEYLVQSYKEQKTELSFKIKELQQRLDSQLPNIL